MYELFNIQNAPRFLDVIHRAVEGKVTRTEWMEQNTRLEYGSAVQLREFFFQTWVPWAEKNLIGFETLCWMRNTPNTYEEWRALYKGMDNTYLQFWENYYDKGIVPRIGQQNGGNSRAAQ